MAAFLREVYIRMVTARRWSRGRVPGVASMTQPVDLSRALRECPGKWVAVRYGEMVDVRDTPYELVMALQEREISDATIVRSPDVGEPELVGLG